MQCISGNWAWILFPSRVGLAILASSYQFINEAGDAGVSELRASARAELTILAARPPMPTVDLTAKLNSWAYRTDASGAGHGAIAAAAAPAEARAEARWAKRRGWHVKLEGTYDVGSAEIDVDARRHRDADASLASKVARQRSSRRPGFLSLFAGSCALES
eukprot:5595155-Pyramimonas_sp.AAC.1